jgi:hypothetical protein
MPGYRLGPAFDVLGARVTSGRVVAAVRGAPVPA